MFLKSSLVFITIKNNKFCYNVKFILNCYQCNAKCSNFVQKIIVVLVTSPKSELFRVAIQLCVNRLSHKKAL